jgi:predicted ester cyclase
MLLYKFEADKVIVTALPELRHHEEAIIAQGDMVVSILNVTGTYTGNFFILPPTGNEIHLKLSMYSE